MNHNDFLQVEESFCGLLLGDEPTNYVPQPTYVDCEAWLGDETEKAYLLLVNCKGKQYLDWFPKSRIILKKFAFEDGKNYIRIDSWIMNQKKPRIGKLVGEEYLMEE